MCLSTEPVAQRQVVLASLLFAKEALGYLEVRFQDGSRSCHDLCELRIMGLPGQRGDGLQDALMHLNLV
jgi:hypothetical protein